MQRIESPVNGESLGNLHSVNGCPVCRSVRFRYACCIADSRVVACSECGFLFSNPQPSDEQLKKIYGDGYFCGAGDPELSRQVEELKRRTAQIYLDSIRAYGTARGTLLELGCGDGYLLAEAEAAGYLVTGLDYSEFAAAKARARLKNGQVRVGAIEDVVLEGEQFDVCVMADVIEHVRDPRRTLALVWERLKPGGILLVATPTLDSWSAKLMGENWMEFKQEHLSYFSRRTLESLLWQTGYETTRFQPGVKSVSLAYVAAHFRKYPAGIWSKLVRGAVAVLPDSAARRPRSIAGSGMTALATKGEIRPRPIVSIIIPVFNEIATVRQLLQAVASKTIPGADREVIVIESNSTDGSREVVRAFEQVPDFKVIYEDQPRGKGAATRLGIKTARGDIILIQDADLEYDLEDYDSLLEPILSGREAFVLGARHGGAFLKMRRFKGAWGTSFIMNLAHWFFTALINLSFGLRLRDPFTMFKVFRRDAVSGIDFRCARFDFDWELLIQLVRKGYRPIEIPVNYRSRSYSEGKKVRFLLDPLTWLATLIRLRFGPGPRP